jgi:nitrile hydratase accessory protein
LNAPEAPFAEPWQAKLFAMTVALNEAGHFSWTEWAAVFGPRVQDQTADTYWEAWSDALVALLSDRGIAEASDVRAMTKAWKAAARATPHGTAIELPSK